MTVPGAMGDSRTRVLLAVVNQWHPTVRSVAAEVGLSVVQTHDHLVRLRRVGLVGWSDGRAGTLHPRVEEVPVQVYATGYTGATTEVGPGAAQTAPDPAITCKEATADGT